MSAFLKSAASGAVEAFVKSLLAGKNQAAAEAAAKASLSGALVMVDSRWAKLAMPLSQVAAEEVNQPDDRRIDLFDSGKPHDAKSLGLVWKLSAAAGAGVEIDVLDAGQLDKLGIKPKDEKRLVVAYAITGGLGASASGNHPAPVWQIGIAASATLDTRCEWYVAAPDSERLGRAFLSALPLMPAPMNLPALLDVADHPDFWGCTTKIEGALQAGFTAKASWSLSGTSVGFDGKQAAFGLSLGVNGHASFALGGKFRLRCMPARQDNGTFKLRVSLDQLDTKEKSLGLELAFGADFSALARSAEAYLRSRTPEVNTDLLDKLTNPAASISKELEAALRKLLGDTGLTDLVPLFAGSGSKDKAVAALAAELVGPLTDKLDILSADLQNNPAAAKQLAEQLLAGLLGKVPATNAASAKVLAFVQDAIGQVLGKLDEGVQELATKLSGTAGNAAEKVLAPLAAFGEQVAEAVGDLSDAISKQKAVKAIRKALTLYGELRSKVLSVLGDAQRAKITATLGIAMQESRSRHVVFEADFEPVADLAPAERLFQALWSGDLRQFSPLIEAATASGSVTNVSGWLELAAKRVVKESFTLNAFGFAFSNTLLRTSDLVLRSDLSGNLLALNGNAGATVKTHNPWVSREASLGINVKLADAGTPQARAAIEFAGAFSASGKNLDEDLFNDLQRSVALLTRNEVPLDLRRLVGTPDPSDETGFKNVWNDATFMLPMSMTADEFSGLARAGDTTARLTILRWALAAMDRSLPGTNIFREDEPPPSELFRGSTNEVIGSTSDAAQLAYLDVYPKRALRWTELARHSEKYGFGVVKIGGTASPAISAQRKLVQFHRLARAVNAFADLRRACHNLDAELARASTTSSEVVFERCFKHLREASDSLSLFAIASETLVGNREPVSWPLVAFACALAEVTRGEKGARFLPLVVLASRPDRPIPLIA